ncbi:uncharacterized protein BDCG_03886 [Blastomyces dermatitidis ER-3]|uniref:Uncharacterized protein n=1 Tax=Ajellomyces dermatitidis (strain ER-3 / ATCC MYA-2586) TaxID=559297 RepID=A0ABP2EXB7_AJEDR|nr:uncharacterized protein BDCG_03886 [Blastomyces dermatitidis ER-3]EEQ88766.1 hypothetical protein BDCG_03886 [Blastomyces dermatitidis ER-3]
MKFCKLNSVVSQAGLEYVREKLQIELLRVTVSEIKLFSGFSLNDHTGSYITVLIERGNSITIAAERAEKELNTDKLTSRRDDTSLQGIVTTAVTAREVEEEEEDMKMRAVLLQLSDTAVFIFN